MSNEILAIKTKQARKKRKKAQRYMKLWRFIGKELGKKHDFNSEDYKDSKVKIQFLSSKKMCDLAKKNRDSTLEHNAKLNRISKEQFLELLKTQNPYVYKAFTSSQTENNGSVFVIPYLRKSGMLKIALGFLPTKNPSGYDVLIYVNKDNIEKRRKEWSMRHDYSFTSKDIRTFLIIHEMIHAYSRLSEKFDALERDLKDSDIESSKLLWKWKAHS